tara:strand:+ start:45 stop:545 length:501 start_codon:yes stop_codon:yes gene_type:complete
MANPDETLADDIIKALRDLGKKSGLISDEEYRSATGVPNTKDAHYAQMDTPKGFEPNMIGPPSGEARYFEEQVMPNDPALAGYPTPFLAPGEQEYMDRRKLVTDNANRAPERGDEFYNKAYVGDDYGYAKRMMDERDNKGKEAVGPASDLAEIISDALRYKRKIEK